MGFYYESVKKSWSLEKIRPKDKVGTEFYDNWYYTKYIILSEIIPTSLGNKKKHRPTDKTFSFFHITLGEMEFFIHTNAL